MWGGAQDARAIDMAFAPSLAEERKAWLQDAQDQIALTLALTLALALALTLALTLTLTPTLTLALTLNT